MQTVHSSFGSLLSTHPRLLFLFALVPAVTVGLVACDSSGSNSNGANTDNNSDNGSDIAKTFTVTVNETDDSYPYNSRNNIGVAYAIDDTVGKVITLERGKTYEFVLESSVASGPKGTSHPFYVGETAKGNGSDAFRDEPALKTSGTVTFAPPSGAPDSLFYQCGSHVYMGGKMKITGSTSGSGGDGGDDGDGGY